MTFNINDISNGLITKSVIIQIYGTDGIGKSTLASQFPKPIFLCTEDGTNELNVSRFKDLAVSSNDVISACSSLYHDEHDYRTLVIDSIDWLDYIIYDEVIKENSDKAVAWGRDALFALEKWRIILNWIYALKNDKMINIVLVAHSEIKRFDPPDGEAYERYQPKLLQKNSALIREFCDCVLFLSDRIFVKKTDSGKRKAIDSERVLYIGRNPAYLAKSRYSLPDEIVMKDKESMFSSFNENMPFAIE